MVSALSADTDNKTVEGASYCMKVHCISAVFGFVDGQIIFTLAYICIIVATWVAAQSRTEVFNQWQCMPWKMGLIIQHSVHGAKNYFLLVHIIILYFFKL